MTIDSKEPRIFLAFRFHANFYHSYRGDTTDELGFGKDIRIIRKIIEVLDHFNAEGVPVRGTWDIENYFSLETIMPEHCPDIIESLKRRVAEGRDEVQVMSYNNGLISAHTASEFDAAVGQAISNEAGSGLRDIFGHFAPMVRPQEMMYTPMHLALYPRHGVEYISLYYSAVPFNAFSNFVARLPLEQRFNPLTLSYPGIDQTMTLVPAHNHGDIADNVSLRWWLKRLRRKQLAMAEPRDLLLLIDADADDEFWYGFRWPVVTRLLAAARGLQGLVETVRDLDFVTFTTPGEYVKTHRPVGVIQIGQDTADGSFDGHSSWAEKWSNHHLWTGVERSRVLELQTRRLMSFLAADRDGQTMEELLEQSRQARLRSLSTTHFGLASPVVNRTRLQTVAGLLQGAVADASRAFELGLERVLEEPAQGADSIEFSLVDYVRGISTDAISYPPKASRALVRLPLSLPAPEAGGVRLLAADGTVRPAGLRPIAGGEGAARSELLFVSSMDGEERRDFRIDCSGGAEGAAPVEVPVSLDAGSLENGLLELRFDQDMQPVGLGCRGIELADGLLVRSAVNYGGRIAEASRWEVAETGILGSGVAGFVKLTAEIAFQADGEKRVSLEREFLLASGLPYLYATTRIAYPETRSSNFDKEKARALEREYDGHWREVMPCEVRPALFGSRDRPLRVWKHNYFDHVSHYDLDYGSFSKNREIDSFNNQITHGWVAVSDGDKGVLVAQTAEVNASHAFCPMRTRGDPPGNARLSEPVRQLPRETAPLPDRLERPRKAGRDHAGGVAGSPRSLLQRTERGVLAADRPLSRRPAARTDQERCRGLRLSLRDPLALAGDPPLAPAKLDLSGAWRRIGAKRAGRCHGVKRTMKALVFPADWRVELVDVEVPRPGPNQVLAEIRCVGICGSDVGIYEGDHWIVARGPGGHGHETGAVAVEVGRDVEGIQPGDHLARMGSGYAQFSTEVNVVGHGKDEELGALPIVRNDLTLEEISFADAVFEMVGSNETLLDAIDLHGPSRRQEKRKQN